MAEQSQKKTGRRGGNLADGTTSSPCFLVSLSTSLTTVESVRCITISIPLGAVHLLGGNALPPLSPTGMAIAAATSRGQMYFYRSYNQAFSSSASRMPASTQVAGESRALLCIHKVCHMVTSLVPKCQIADVRCCVVEKQKRRGLSWIGPRRCDSISRGNQNGRGFADAPTAVGYVIETS